MCDSRQPASANPGDLRKINHRPCSNKNGGTYSSENQELNERLRKPSCNISPNISHQQQKSNTFEHTYTKNMNMSAKSTILRDQMSERRPYKTWHAVLVLYSRVERNKMHKPRRVKLHKEGGSYPADLAACSQI